MMTNPLILGIILAISQNFQKKRAINQNVRSLQKHVFLKSSKSFKRENLENEIETFTNQFRNIMDKQTGKGS